ncbi:MAG TPA: hypothetical protein VF618_23415 [Thermoanaerobaculia bacterium]
MPFSSRPQDVEGNYYPGTPGRRPGRTFEIKRSKSGNGGGSGSYQSRGASKQAPPESTNAENFYYLKQMAAKTPMVIVMNDGEQIRGWIEWYDKTSIKVNREGAPNLLIQKHWIKYLHKADEL